MTVPQKEQPWLEPIKAVEKRVTIRFMAATLVLLAFTIIMSEHSRRTITPRAVASEWVAKLGEEHKKLLWYAARQDSLLMIVTDRQDSIRTIVFEVKRR